MDESGDPVEFALAIDVTAAAAAVQVALVEEAGRQADALLGAPPLPGSLEWHAAHDGASGTVSPVRRERAWQLLQLRLLLGAGVDPLPVLIGLRRHGSSWAEIGRAAGTTRQSAHERWAETVAAVLDPDGAGRRSAGDGDGVMPYGEVREGE